MTFARYILILFISLFISACADDVPLLQKIKNDGKLVIATRNSPTTYYITAVGPAGFEYDLAKLFADELGVELDVLKSDNLTGLLPMVTSRKAHFAAAGLTVTDKRKQQVQFGPVYQTIKEQVIYHKENTKPENINDLANGTLEVISSSSHVEHLKKLVKDYPELDWHGHKELEIEELLSLVWEQVVDYTIADSNDVALNQRFYPELKVAFDLTEPQSLAWAFPIDRDRSLYDAATAFFEKIKNNGDLKNITDRYYAHVDPLSVASKRSFSIHYSKRFPRFREMFQQAAEANNIDWRVLAAMGYQESHWNPRAKSPTGVRGIMMLTQDTAKFLGVTKRMDPKQSIEGGARYFTRLKKAIPDQIKEPDRTWFALASYNIGRGHVEDARNITKKRGADPDKWLHVKENLPLLRKKKWYKKTKYGYARGNETVRYVENIRTYYDYLVWLTDQEESSDPILNKAIDIKSLAL